MKLIAILVLVVAGSGADSANPGFFDSEEQSAWVADKLRLTQVNHVKVSSDSHNEPISMDLWDKWYTTLSTIEDNIESAQYAEALVTIDALFGECASIFTTPTKDTRVHNLEARLRMNKIYSLWNLGSHIEAMLEVRGLREFVNSYTDKETIRECLLMVVNYENEFNKANAHQVLGIPSNASANDVGDAYDRQIAILYEDKDKYPSEKARAYNELLYIRVQQSYDSLIQQ